MLTSSTGKQLHKYVPDYVLFDLETTGISCNADEIIEISAVKVKNGNVVDEFSQLVNPKRKIPYGATAVNGITDKMVKDEPTFEEVLPEFITFIGEEILVGHNIQSFDLKFIYRDCEKYLGKIPNNDYVDTLKFARKALPGLSHYKLTDLASYYNLSTEGAHRAINDCRMNQKVFELLGKEAQNISKKTADEPICPKCGEILLKRNGKFGEFLGCSGFPNCRYTKNV